MFWNLSYRNNIGWSWTSFEERCRFWDEFLIRHKSNVRENASEFNLFLFFRYQMNWKILGCPIQRRKHNKQKLIATIITTECMDKKTDWAMHDLQGIFIRSLKTLSWPWKSISNWFSAHIIILNEQAVWFISFACNTSQVFFNAWNQWPLHNTKSYKWNVWSSTHAFRP